jgi:hypothetical protein
MPWEVTWPNVTVAYIRVSPRSDAELEADESCNAVTYVYGEREGKVDVPIHEEEEVLESAQPVLCLPSSRLDQYEGKAQADGGMETPEEESNARGKSGDPSITIKDCTVAVDLKHQLAILRDPLPDTFPAIISFQKQSVQMFFSPENAIADFKRKVRELWNIPMKMYYLLVNGLHESLVKTWQGVTSVVVQI